MMCVLQTPPLSAATQASTFGSIPLVITPLPFPVRYHIYFGEPMEFRGNANDEDQVIEAKVEQVKARIRSMLESGLRRRKSVFF